MIAATYASSPMAEKQPFSMSGCERVVSDMAKHLPSRVDEITTRTGAKCVQGNTKPSMLVFFDSVESNNSQNKNIAVEGMIFALSSNGAKQALMKSMCADPNTNKLLPLLDITKKIFVKNTYVASVLVSEASCEQHKIYLEINPNATPNGYVRCESRGQEIVTCYRKDGSAKICRPNGEMIQCRELR